MDIMHLRRQIDELDQELIVLLNRRAAIALEIGVLKKAANESIRDNEREKAVLQSGISANKGPLPDEAIRRIFTEIIRTSRELQNASV